MTKYLIRLSFVFILINLSCTNGTNKDTHTVNDKTFNSDKMKVLRHIVLFKFKPGVAEEEIVKVVAAFGELTEKIKEIKGFEWGINNSPENLNKGFTHGFLLTFNSESDRAKYLPHPDHKAFGNILEPILEDVLVIDYWTN